VKIRPRRLALMSVALLLLVATPWLNLYGIDFFQGWFQSLSIGSFWFVSPLEGLESILVSRAVALPLLVAMAVPVLIAVLLGRVFCGWICPVHFLSELSDIVLNKLNTTWRRDRWILSRRWLWGALVGELVLTMVLGAPLFVFLSPPGLVGRELMMAVFFQTLTLEGMILLAVLGVNLVTRRFYCRYLCPLGALLGLLGGRRRLLITKNEADCTQCGQCESRCPLGLSPRRGEGQSLYCWNCGECTDACPTECLRFSWRQEPPS